MRVSLQRGDERFDRRSPSLPARPWLSATALGGLPGIRFGDWPDAACPFWGVPTPGQDRGYPGRGGRFTRPGPFGAATGFQRSRRLMSSRPGKEMPRRDGSDRGSSDVFTIRIAYQIMDSCATKTDITAGVSSHESRVCPEVPGAVSCDQGRKRCGFLWAFSRRRRSIRLMNLQTACRFPRTGLSRRLGYRPNGLNMA